MTLLFQKIDYGSDYYEQAKRLRNDVLRVPIGLFLSEEDIADDVYRLHYAALKDNDVVGTLSMRPLSSETIKLRQMAVAIEWQGQAIGQRLVAYAEQAVRVLGYRKIVTDARCAAQRFYERLGYAAHDEPFMETTVLHVAMQKAL